MKGESFGGIRNELRRGSLILAVAGALRTERYGYTLRKALQDKGIEIDEGTLYPLLRRMETQGLLLSEWREQDKRKRRFYHLTQVGEQTLQELQSEWLSFNKNIEGILNESTH